MAACANDTDFWVGAPKCPYGAHASVFLEATEPLPEKQFNIVKWNLHFNGSCACVTDGINQDPYYKWLSCPDPTIKATLLADADAYVKFLSELEPGKVNTQCRFLEPPKDKFVGRIVNCSTGEEVPCKITYSTAPPFETNIKAKTVSL